MLFRTLYDYSIYKSWSKNDWQKISLKVFSENSFAKTQNTRNPLIKKNNLKLTKFWMYSIAGTRWNAKIANLARLSNSFIKTEICAILSMSMVIEHQERPNRSFSSKWNAMVWCLNTFCCHINLQGAKTLIFQTLSWKWATGWSFACESGVGRHFEC